MKFKKSILIVLIVLTIISIGAVSAAIGYEIYSGHDVTVPIGAQEHILVETLEEGRGMAKEEVQVFVNGEKNHSLITNEAGCAYYSCPTDKAGVFNVKFVWVNPDGKTLEDTTVVTVQSPPGPGSQPEPQPQNKTNGTVVTHNDSAAKAIKMKPTANGIELLVAAFVLLSVGLVISHSRLRN